LTYSKRHNFITRKPVVSKSTNFRAGKVPLWLIWIITIVLLISSGITYRSLASLIIDTAINLPLPLNTLPIVIGDWTGIEMSIPTTTREYMEANFADDYVSRRYINNRNQSYADIYIVYCASRPGGMLGHQPRVCYPGNGWIHGSTEKTHFTTRQGREIPCLIHRFHKPAPMYDEIVILNFYLVNGKLATNQSGFSGVLGRRYNLSRNPARYVAQIQISSLLENSIINAASDMTELILDLLPDENGIIRAAELTRPKSETLSKTIN
jgi:hypothetical protein